MANRKVFIVHGHDAKAKADLKGILVAAGVQPIILMEQPDGGSKTIIEKFEYYAEQCVFALVLLTPDDLQASQLKKAQRYRARQNVIFEMGWFFKHLGRNRTRLLHKGAVELPSDTTGIIYLRFRKHVGEIAKEIVQALADGGLRIRHTTHADERKRGL